MYSYKEIWDYNVQDERNLLKIVFLDLGRGTNRTLKDPAHLNKNDIISIMGKSIETSNSYVFAFLYTI